jgi:hypothetical protein
MALLLVRVAAVYDHINAIEAAFEKALVGLKLKLVRHDTRSIREHAILGDDGITFDATRKG